MGVMRRGRELQVGDRVAIVAPSGAVAPELIEGAVAALERCGLRAVVGKHALGYYKAHHAIALAGTIEQRLHDLQWAVNSDDIAAIWCARGGYGAVQLLDALDLSALTRSPKWLIGFSDISALHAAFFNAGMMSIHAPMAKHLTQHGTTDEVMLPLLQFLMGKDVFPVYHQPFHPFNRLGKATATITGGNLAVLSALVATPYNMLLPGHILFIEDIAEEIYRVERLLYQLKLSGVLPRLAGLIVGHFTRYHVDGLPCDSNDGDEHQAMYGMIAAMVKDYDYPVVFDFPVGHVAHNVSMIEGAKATLAVESGATHLSFEL